MSNALENTELLAAHSSYSFLHTGQTHVIPAGSGLRLRVISGAVWLTTEGSGSDVVVKSDFHYSLDEMKNVVIEGLTETIFEILVA